MASLTSSRLGTVQPNCTQATRRPVVPLIPAPTSTALPVLVSSAPRATPSLPVRTHRRRVCRAAGEAGVKEVVEGKTEDGAQWVPVCKPEDLPKGVRKEVDVDGAQVLLFWYRNQIFCIQARSPAEGAYSEGFIKAKFTQDYCIECPSTGSLFSLKDGSIVSWYPGNPVLAALTPKDTCLPLEIYPVKLAQEAIYVDVSDARFARRMAGKGGSDSSLENNNVFSVQPVAYFEGMDPSVERASLYMDNEKARAAPNPAVAIATTAGVALFAVAGTAVCIYLENVVLLAAFWVALGGAAAYVSYQYVLRNEKK